MIKLKLKIVFLSPNISTTKYLPSVYNSFFLISSTSRNYETLFTAKDDLKIPTVPTKICGKRAFIIMATKNIE